MVNQYSSVKTLKQLLEDREGGIQSHRLVNKEDMPAVIPIRQGLTLNMNLIEQLYGDLIENILAAEKPSKELAERLGVTKSCISRWRKRLGIKAVERPFGEK